MAQLLGGASPGHTPSRLRARGSRHLSIDYVGGDDALPAAPSRDDDDPEPPTRPTSTPKPVTPITTISIRKTKTTHRFGEVFLNLAASAAAAAAAAASTAATAASLAAGAGAAAAAATAPAVPTAPSEINTGGGGGGGGPLSDIDESPDSSNLSCGGDDAAEAVHPLAATAAPPRRPDSFHGGNGAEASELAGWSLPRRAVSTSHPVHPYADLDTAAALRNRIMMQGMSAAQVPATLLHSSRLARTNVFSRGSLGDLDGGGGGGGGGGGRDALHHRPHRCTDTGPGAAGLSAALRPFSTPLPRLPQSLEVLRPGGPLPPAAWGEGPTPGRGRDLAARAPPARTSSTTGVESPEAAGEGDYGDDGGGDGGGAAAVTDDPQSPSVGAVSLPGCVPVSGTVGVPGGVAASAAASFMTPPPQHHLHQHHHQHQHQQPLQRRPQLYQLQLSPAVEGVTGGAGTGGGGQALRPRPPPAHHRLPLQSAFTSGHPFGQLFIPGALSGPDASCSAPLMSCGGDAGNGGGGWAQVHLHGNGQDGQDGAADGSSSSSLSHLIHVGPWQQQSPSPPPASPPTSPPAVLAGMAALLEVVAPTPRKGLLNTPGSTSLRWDFVSAVHQDGGLTAARIHKLSAEEDVAAAGWCGEVRGNGDGDGSAHGDGGGGAVSRRRGVSDVADVAGGGDEGCGGLGSSCLSPPPGGYGYGYGTEPGEAPASPFTFPVELSPAPLALQTPPCAPVPGPHQPALVPHGPANGAAASGTADGGGVQQRGRPPLPPVLPRLSSAADACPAAQSPLSPLAQASRPPRAAKMMTAEAGMAATAMTAAVTAEYGEAASTTVASSPSAASASASASSPRLSCPDPSTPIASGSSRSSRRILQLLGGGGGSAGSTRRHTDRHRRANAVHHAAVAGTALAPLRVPSGTCAQEAPPPLPLPSSSSSPCTPGGASAAPHGLPLSPRLSHSSSLSLSAVGRHRDRDVVLPERVRSWGGPPAAAAAVESSGRSEGVRRDRHRDVVTRMKAALGFLRRGGD